MSTGRLFQRDGPTHKSAALVLACDSEGPDDLHWQKKDANMASL